MLPDHSGATKVPDPSTIEVYTIWEKNVSFSFVLSVSAQRSYFFCARQTDVIVDYLLLLILVGAGCGRG